MKKKLPYILILIILVGLFGVVGKAQAAITIGAACKTSDGKDGVGQMAQGVIVCTPTAIAGAPIVANPDSDIGNCTLPDGSEKTGWTRLSCTQNNGTSFVVTTAATITTATTAPKSEFETQVGYMKCGIMDGSIWPGCFVQASYGIFYQLSAFILALAAKFFNVLITITLSSTLFAASTFIPTAWAVVRDLSNIFFILILLYIAIKIILGLGGSEVKKMIARVVIIALLINFSMFFTEVIIDTSNILALVFYNKLNTCTTVSINGQPAQGCAPYDGGTDPSKTGIVSKDVSGAMVNSFNPTNSLTWENFFKQVRTSVDANGKLIPGATEIPLEKTGGVMMALILVSGAVMLFAAYCFFMSGLSFLGRLIELWVLIIAAPFAFMSSTVPKLSGIERWGWEAWLKRLLGAAFMAPVFMFLLYLIFLLLKAPGLFNNLVTNNGSGLVGAINTILLFVIPAMVILSLLLKATKFAKEYSGKYTEDILKGAKMVGGLALGAAGLATGGAAVLGAGLGKRVIGGGGGALANKAAGWAERKGLGRTASKLRDVGAFAQKSSFDVRGIPGASKMLGMAGLATGAGLLGKAQQGGWAEMKKQQVEKRQKRADELVKRGTGKNKKKLDEAQAKLNEATLPVKVDLEQADKVMEKFRRELGDAQKAGDTAGITAAKSGLDTAKRTKVAIRTRAGLDTLERDIHDAQRELDTETGRIAGEYAKKISGVGSKAGNLIFRLGAYSVAGADEASRNIRKGAKVEEKH